MLYILGAFMFCSVYNGRLSPQVEWYDQSLAGSQDFPISAAENLLLVRYAPTVPVCAVALNQLSMRDHCIMFVSPEHHCLTTSNLRFLRESPTSGRRCVYGYSTMADSCHSYFAKFFLLSSISACFQSRWLLQRTVQ